MGFALLFFAILSLIFRAFDIVFIGLAWWGFWLFIPAFFILLGGSQQIYTNKRLKKVIEAALLDHKDNGTYNLEDIALELGIKPQNILRVLTDLRVNGIINYRFNSDTGELILSESGNAAH